MIEKNATAVSYAASSTALIFGLTASEFAAIAGVVIGVATFLVNWYYKAKADARAEADE